MFKNIGIYVKEKKVMDQKLQPEVHVKRGQRYLINVGSVGQPRDGDWRASYVVYDHPKRLLKFRRLEYPMEVTQKKIIDAGLPEKLANRLESAY